MTYRTRAYRIQASADIIGRSPEPVSVEPCQKTSDAYFDIFAAMPYSAGLGFNNGDCDKRRGTGEITYSESIVEECQWAYAFAYMIARHGSHEEVAAAIDLIWSNFRR